jgi:hypothetical protein
MQSMLHALSGSGRLFQFGPDLRKSLDQAADEIVRPGVWDIRDHFRHVHHGVAPEHAQLEIIKEQNLHRSP